jgi:ABC-type phosphate transport system substrate-binding protein
VLLGLLPLGASSAAALAHSQIMGSGSLWAAIPVDDWATAGASLGLPVDYTPLGSAQGRRDFALNESDFAVTDVPYQGTDPVTGGTDSSSRAYTYLPLVAGGMSFPYQIVVDGQQVRDLRLSGLTLAKIFTGQITNWNDPAITADNNGRVLPDLQIVPIVHSEAAGASMQFSSYMASQFPFIWTYGVSEYYPLLSGLTALSGSDNVINAITAANANGAIGIDEYSYALGRNYPVAKVRNAAGYYTLPNQYDVAIALTAAHIDQHTSSRTYLQADLRDVYTNPDPRTYPLSAYAYLIIPTSATDGRETTPRRQTIADFVAYALCQGQRAIGQLGYAPLPENLVQAGFDQLAKLHTADAGVDLSADTIETCANDLFSPTQLSNSTLNLIAPLPAACDRDGAGPCTDPADTGTPTTTALTMEGGAGGGAGHGTLAATVNPGTVTGRVTFSDNGIPIASVSAQTSPGEYLLDRPNGFPPGVHFVVAAFTPDPGPYAPSVSNAIIFSTPPASSEPCQQADARCSDQANVQGTIPVGTLIITTPYDAAHPLDLGTLTLTPNASLYTTSAPIGPIRVTDLRAGDLPYTVSALASPLSDGGTNPGSTINGENLGLTGLVPTSGTGFAGTITVLDNPAADPPVAPGDSGTQGLGNAPHPLATVTKGLGTVTFAGQVTLNAPASIEPGLFAGTITMTVG